MPAINKNVLLTFQPSGQPTNPLSTWVVNPRDPKGRESSLFVRIEFTVCPKSTPDTSWWRNHLKLSDKMDTQFSTNILKLLDDARFAK